MGEGPVRRGPKETKKKMIRVDEKEELHRGRIKGEGKDSLEAYEP